MISESFPASPSSTISFLNPVSDCWISLILFAWFPDATVQAAGAKRENVHVAINDVSLDEWGTGGKSMREIKAES